MASPPTASGKTRSRSASSRASTTRSASSSAAPTVYATRNICGSRCSHACSQRSEVAKNAHTTSRRPYEKVLNSLPDDEAVLFADAVHPTHAARPAGCWAPSQENLAIEQTSGRQRINIHGAVDLETGQTRMIEVETVDAASTIRLLESIEAFYPMLVLIHVFLDNASYHHAKIVREWLAQPGRRIKLHFIPPYCPHLNPIERLWGVMHKHITHNKSYATCAQFADATLGFLREKVPRNWADLCDSVTDNFRIINPKDFRVVT